METASRERPSRAPSARTCPYLFPTLHEVTELELRGEVTTVRRTEWVQPLPPGTTVTLEALTRDDHPGSRGCRGNDACEEGIQEWLASVEDEVYAAEEAARRASAATEPRQVPHRPPALLLLEAALRAG